MIANRQILIPQDAPAPDGPEFNNGVYYPTSELPEKTQSAYESEAMSYVFGALTARFGDREDVRVTMNMPIYYLLEGYRVGMVWPEIAVMFGVDGKRDRPRWMTWDEKGILPSLVINIESPNEWSDSIRYKREEYARLGVGECWRIDPSGNPSELSGDHLVNGTYQPIEVSADQSGIARGHSDILGLELCVHQNFVPNLRLYDPHDGEWLSTLLEARQAIEESQAEIRRLRELLAQR